MNIKRPIILFLSSLILGILFAYNNIDVLFKILILIIAIILYGRLFIKNKITLKIICFIIIFFIIGFYRFKFEDNINNDIDTKVENFEKGNKTLTAIVETIGKSTNSNYFVLNNCEVNGVKLGRARCYFSDDISNDVKIGNTIKIVCKIKGIDEPSNFGEFNQKNYYRSININFIAFIKSIEIVNDNYDKLKQKIYEMKLVIKNQIYKIFDEKDAGIFSAMITGDKSTIDKEIRKLYNDNGIAHILAISGLHLSILGLSIFELLRKRFSILFSGTFVGIFIFLYGIFIDAGATSLRAITMLYVRFISLAIGRTYDSKNTLYIVCFAFLMINPYLLLNAGFQFSYLAIFALNTDFNIIRMRNDGKELKCIKVHPSITLTLFLLPITIYNYFTYPTYSIILNLIVIPLMSFVLGFGLFSLGLSFISLNLGKFVGLVVHFILLLYEILCRTIEKIPYNKLITGKPNLYEILFFYVVLFLIIYILSKKLSDLFVTNDITTNNKNSNKNDANENNNDENIHNKNNFIIKNIFIKFRYVLCFVSLLISILALCIRNHYDFRLTFLSIGQGDSSIIEANDTIITIDGGSTSNTSAGEYILAPHIKARGIDHIDHAFISHSDADHTNAIKYIFENDDDIKIHNLYLPINARTNVSFDELKNLAETNNTTITYLKETDELSIKNGMNIKVLSPDEDSVNNNINKKGKEIYDVNNLSLTFRLDYMNHSILFTGDIGKNMINRMINDDYNIKNLQTEIFKVPHHGSKNSNVEEFYKIIKPTYSVVSYGYGNSYGHPHKITMDTLSPYTTMIYKTGESGEIDFIFNNNKNKKKGTIIKTFK